MVVGTVFIQLGPDYVESVILLIACGTVGTCDPYSVSGVVTTSDAVGPSVVTARIPESGPMCLLVVYTTESIPPISTLPQGAVPGPEPAPVPPGERTDDKSSIRNSCSFMEGAAGNEGVIPTDIFTPGYLPDGDAPTVGDNVLGTRYACTNSRPTATSEVMLVPLAPPSTVQLNDGGALGTVTAVPSPVGACVCSDGLSTFMLWMCPLLFLPVSSPSNIRVCARLDRVPFLPSIDVT